MMFGPASQKYFLVPGRGIFLFIEIGIDLDGKEKTNIEVCSSFHL